MTGIFFKLVLTFAFCNTAVNEEIPNGWIKAGSAATKYEAGIMKDKTIGSKVAFLRSVDDSIKGFGTLMQQCKADVYKGLRLKMTGIMRCEYVTERAGFWLRIDQEGTTTPLGFDNMSKQPVSGNTGWARYEIVLDVPHNADAIAFGALLMGNGQLWVDDIKFEVVDNSVPVTAQSALKKMNKLPAQPVNLNFD